MNRFTSKIHGNPSELEYYANKIEYDFQEMRDRKREIVCMHNREFEIARNCERGTVIDKILNDYEKR